MPLSTWEVMLCTCASDRALWCKDTSRHHIPGCFPMQRRHGRRCTFQLLTKECHDKGVMVLPILLLAML